MYGCESWTIKKAGCGRIDVFELWCWRRLLRDTWTARRSNQSILQEVTPGCSLEGLMLKLKRQYFDHLMQRADSFEKTLMLERLRGRGEREDRGLDGWMASPTQWTWVWVNSRSCWWTGRSGSPWGCKESDTTEQLNNNTKECIHHSLPELCSKPGCQRINYCIKESQSASSPAWCKSLNL